MSTNVSKSEWIKWLISLGMGAVCLIIPESELFTWNVKIFLCVTVVGLAFAAFEIVPTIMVSVLMPCLWILFKVTTVDVILSSWVNTTMLMVVGALFMAASLEQSGLLRRLAFYLMCSVKGSYLALLYSIGLVTVLLNILTSGRGYIVMIALSLGLCVTMDGVQKNLGAGLTSAVIIGGCTSHIYTFQATTWGVLLQLSKDYIPQGAVNPFSIMLHNWPMFFVSFALIYVAAKMFPVEGAFGEITWFKEQLSKMGPISRREKVNAFMVIAVLIYTFTINLHGLDLNLGYAIIPWIVYLPFMNGADKDTVKKINYEVIFFMAACLGIGTIASNLGFGAAIAEMLKGLLNGSTNPMMLTALIFIIVFMLNLLMTPIAIFSLIAIPVLGVCVDMGINPLGVAYAISACSEAILFPYEYIPYLIVFGFGMQRMSDFIKFNAVRSVVVFLGMVFVITPYWMLIGVI